MCCFITDYFIFICFDSFHFIHALHFVHELLKYPEMWYAMVSHILWYACHYWYTRQTLLVLGLNKN